MAKNTLWRLDSIRVRFLISSEQIDICNMKASGKTIKEIREKHNVNELSQLWKCPSKFFMWIPFKSPHQAKPYLGPMDVLQYKLEIESNSINLDYLRTIDGIELTYTIKRDRFE